MYFMEIEKLSAFLYGILMSKLIFFNGILFRIARNGGFFNQ